jgi:CheY-like chemotaxis protein
MPQSIWPVGPGPARADRVAESLVPVVRRVLQTGSGPPVVVSFARSCGIRVARRADWTRGDDRVAREVANRLARAFGPAVAAPGADRETVTDAAASADGGRETVAVRPEPEGRVRGRGVRVLCVDDQPSVAESLAAVLGVAGYDARACYDAPSAQAVAANFRPHACVLDLNMPRLDGYEVARWLRESMGRSVLLVALTVDPRPNLDRQAAEAGFDLVFLKSIDPDRLIRALDGRLAAPGGPTS